MAVNARAIGCKLDRESFAGKSPLLVVCSSGLNTAKKRMSDSLRPKKSTISRLEVVIQTTAGRTRNQEKSRIRSQRSAGLTLQTEQRSLNLCIIRGFNALSSRGGMSMLAAQTSLASNVVLSLQAPKLKVQLLILQIGND